MASKILRRVAGCRDGSCPTVYLSDQGTLIVQGYTVDLATMGQVSVPEGEAVVEIPLGLLDDLHRVRGDLE